MEPNPYESPRECIAPRDNRAEGKSLVRDASLGAVMVAIGAVGTMESLGQNLLGAAAVCLIFVFVGIAIIAAGWQAWSHERRIEKRTVGEWNPPLIHPASQDSPNP